MSDFTEDLGHSVYQESKWVKQPLIRNNESYRDEINRVLSAWRGHRYDEELLQKFQIDFIRNSSVRNAIRQSAAILGFSGLNEGHAATYWSYGYRNVFVGREEYWALARYWPKDPSPELYRLRAIHYSLVGGNIELRNPAFKRYLDFDPKDELIVRMEITSRYILKSSYGPKQTESELLKDYKMVKSMYSDKHETHALAGAYKMVTALYAKFPKAAYRKDSLELGEKLVAEYSKNSIDSRIVPGIEEYLENLRKGK